MDDERRHTLPVDDDVFRTVYDSPASLPGCYKWLTSDEDVRRIESLLGMSPGTIGAPLWLSGDEKSCSSCGRLISWLDIVSSGVAGVHSPEMIANVILGIGSTSTSRLRVPSQAFDARSAIPLSRVFVASSATTGPTPSVTCST
jgi:hypothetical protein